LSHTRKSLILHWVFIKYVQFEKQDWAGIILDQQWFSVPCIGCTVCLQQSMWVYSLCERKLDYAVSPSTLSDEREEFYMRNGRKRLNSCNHLAIDVLR
jgi:hypothetical protein